MKKNNSRFVPNNSKYFNTIRLETFLDVSLAIFISAANSLFLIISKILITQKQRHMRETE